MLIVYNVMVTSALSRTPVRHFKNRTDHQNASQHSQTPKNRLTTKVHNLDFFLEKIEFLLQIFEKFGFSFLEFKSSRRFRIVLKRPKMDSP